MENTRSSKESNGCGKKCWEKIIPNFLIELYHKQIISMHQNWAVHGDIIREEFNRYLSTSTIGKMYKNEIYSVYGQDSIKRLLILANVIENIPCEIYQINKEILFKYRDEKLAEYDGDCLKNVREVIITQDVPLNAVAVTDEPLIDEESPRWYLVYQKTQSGMPNTRQNALSSTSCHICLIDFKNMFEFEEHIEYHSEVSNFKSLEKLNKLPSSMLRLSYQLCIDSHYFGFTLNSNLKDVIIEKIIVIQSRSFHYCATSEMPLKLGGSRPFRFFVDSHIFMRYTEQPIVIIFHLASSSMLYVEHHHFVRTEEFPVVHLSLHSCRLSSANLFKCNFKFEKQYMPPLKLIELLNNEAATNEEFFAFSTELRDYILNEKRLTRNKYTEILTFLLQIEDAEILKPYKSITQTNTVLRQFGENVFVIMKVPEDMVLESILSVDDFVLITPTKSTNIYFKGNQNKLHYYASIEHIKKHRVVMSSKSRSLPVDIACDLHFSPSRLNFRYQYRSLELLKRNNMKKLEDCLFPTAIGIKTTTISMDLKLFNKNIRSNPEQLQAVQRIASGDCLVVPYIIFGPPGTGKTATICEVIMQLYVRHPNTRILVMSGSNSACNELALRLLSYIAKSKEPYSLTRIFANAYGKSLDKIDDILLEYSNMYKAHFYPDVDTVHQYRIVICTLSVAAKLSTGGFGLKSGCSPVFTHVFVDEAAASTEPEVLVGLTNTIDNNVSLILSGDHKQLGPVLKSKRAELFGLGISLMDRLLKRDCYSFDDMGNYNKNIQTRLLCNYRSHPEIVNIYNKLYYGNTLKALAPKNAYSLAVNWHLLPNPDFPIIFHCVFGQATTTSDSLSLRNNKEVNVVMDYVKDLMYFGINGQTINQKDIGIISPYKSQYMLIQEQLNIRKWCEIECGSVETFQGQEKQIIIVSFVRSNCPTLGFLHNPRRLNVTLSRAKCLLIMIGNPITLSRSHDFKYVIDICKEKGTLVGERFSNYSPDKNLQQEIAKTDNMPPDETENKYPFDKVTQREVNNRTKHKQEKESVRVYENTMESHVFIYYAAEELTVTAHRYCCILLFFFLYFFFY